MKLITIKLIWRVLNANNFGGVLVEPRIGFSRTRRVDGFWESAGRFMMFNLTDTKGFVSVIELVYHEMIHQYIDEFLNLTVEDDHGKEFKRQYNKFARGIVRDVNYVQNS